MSDLASLATRSGSFLACVRVLAIGLSSREDAVLVDVTHGRDRLERGVIGAPDRAKARRGTGRGTRSRWFANGQPEDGQALKRGRREDDPPEGRAEILLVNITADPSTASVVASGETGSRPFACWLHSSVRPLKENQPPSLRKTTQPSTAISASLRIFALVLRSFMATIVPRP